MVGLVNVLWFVFSRFWVGGFGCRLGGFWLFVDFRLILGVFVVGLVGWIGGYLAVFDAGWGWYNIGCWFSEGGLGG